MRNESTLKDYVWEEAEELGVDLESVETVSNTEDSVTLRVLLKDGDSEKDQVGFQASRPNVDTGRNMFNRRITNGLRELRKIQRGESDSSSEETSDPSTTGETEESPVVETDSVPPSDQAEPQLGSLSVRVDLDEDSRSELTAEFESIFEDIQDSTVSPEQLESIEQRIDDLDSRLRKFEETFSAFSQD